MKKALIFIGKLLVTLSVLGFVVHKLGWRDILDSFRQAQPEWLAAALVLFLVSGGAGVVQWVLLLRNRTIQISFSKAFVLYFIGMFFNNFILGTAAGDAVRVAYIRLQNGKGKAGLAATFLDRFAGLWAMLGFAVAGSFILLRRGLVQGLPLTTAVVSLFATFVFFLGILVFLMAPPLQRMFISVLHRLPIPKKESLETLVSQMLLETKDIRLMVEVAVLSTFIQLMRVGVHILCGASLGLLTVHNFQYFFIFVPILAITMIAPLPFGVREALGGTLFALAGFKAESAIVMEFLATLVGVVASSLGAVFFLTMRMEHRGDTKDALVDNILSNDEGVSAVESCATGDTHTVKTSYDSKE